MRRPNSHERAMAVLDEYGVPREALRAAERAADEAPAVMVVQLSLAERIRYLGRAVPALMGAKQVASLLGTTTSNLQFHKQLPEHVVDLPNGRLWLAEDIEEYAKTREARRGKRAG